MKQHQGSWKCVFLLSANFTWGPLRLNWIILRAASSSIDRASSHRGVGCYYCYTGFRSSTRCSLCRPLRLCTPEGMFASQCTPSHWFCDRFSARNKQKMHQCLLKGRQLSIKLSPSAPVSPLASARNWQKLSGGEKKRRTQKIAQIFQQNASVDAPKLNLTRGHDVRTAHRCFFNPWNDRGTTRRCRAEQTVRESGPSAEHSRPCIYASKWSWVDWLEMQVHTYSTRSFARNFGYPYFHEGISAVVEPCGRSLPDVERTTATTRKNHCRMHALKQSFSTKICTFAFHYNNWMLFSSSSRSVPELEWSRWLLCFSLGAHHPLTFWRRQYCPINKIVFAQKYV